MPAKRLLASVLLLLSLPAETLAEGAAAGAEFPVPLFRYVDPTQPAPTYRPAETVKFLADASFPPFSYRDAGGTLTGFSVALADALCVKLRLTCEFVVKPWEEVEAALGRREGDAVLSGVRLSEDTLARMSFTRPFLRTLGRFAVRTENEALAASPRGLAGKRIGVIGGTAHEALLSSHFQRATLRLFDTQEAARKALQTGGIDALFDDGFRLMFWLASAESGGCCRFAAGAYTDPRTVSTPIAIGVRKDDRGLRDLLDHGLDRLQSDGTFAALYRRFFPVSVW